MMDVALAGSVGVGVVVPPGVRPHWGIVVGRVAVAGTRAAATPVGWAATKSRMLVSTAYSKPAKSSSSGMDATKSRRARNHS